MTDHDALWEKLINLLRKQHGDRVSEFLLPPPIFTLMQGEFLEIDVDGGILKTRFPVLESYQNPYKTMQGGMIATAVDNTIGPLSVLIAPPNVTRTLDMKYSKAITLDMEAIIVTAKLIDRDEHRLYINAEVRSPAGKKLASAKAVHWII